MPSPIAHCSLALAAWPPIERRLAARDVPRARRIVFLGALLAALVAPDFDIVLDPLMGRPWFEGHGGPGHSLVAGLIFAGPFALLGRLIVPLPLAQLWLIGLAAFWSHILLDACTYGRGVALLWPLTPQRFGLPVPIFFGVRHESWTTWGLHATTITTELAFATVVWGVARLLAPRAARPSAHPRRLKMAGGA